MLVKGTKNWKVTFYSLLKYVQDFIFSILQSSSNNGSNIKKKKYLSVSKIVLWTFHIVMK